MNHAGLGGSACIVSLLALASCAAHTEPAANSADPRPACAEPRGNTDALRVLHPRLAARICGLEARSPRFHAEMSRLRAGDLPVYVGTAAQVRNAQRRAAVLGRRLPPQRLADFSVLHDPATGEIDALVVRVELDRLPPLLRHWARDNPRWRGTRAELDEILDGILIHELWGHLVPVARARGLGGQCADPRPRQAELESCVMRRENELRRELGMPTRTRYALSRWDR